ncbi:MAG: methionine--tRNA ligase [Alphaproteobacteria bacterium]|nr:methionine--tRNA ligase [Alphaproteobacteria bacterium]
MKKIFITTPIFYVNDSPHIGHAYTTIICDALAKFYRLDDYEVLFTTGTDEHGLKVEKAAKKDNTDPKVFVDKVSENFINLSKRLKISNTDFVRTTEKRHQNAAKNFWKLLNDKNQIYLSKYEGWYSVRDEAFYQEKELNKKGERFYTNDGEEVQWIEEESFFFKLSEWGEKLLKYFEENPDFILPVSRKNEVISFVKSGLKDLSISRTSFNWGIKIDGSENHIMYVWIDALVNYLTSIDFPKTSKDQFLFWKNCYHIIGKDILKFHAVYWPAMLMAAEIPLPKKIFAHGWWTNEGKKISKSVGNVIDPHAMIDKFGLDQLRHFLLREVTLGQDGDFSEHSFKTRINADLSNNLGNLIQRTLKFVGKNFENKMPFDLQEPKNKDLLSEVYNLFPKVKISMEKFKINKSIEEIFIIITKLNQFMDKAEPWNSFKTNPQKTANDLSVLIESFRIIGILLQPFIPDASNEILNILNIEKKYRKFKFLNFMYKINKDHCIKETKPLFPKYD